MLGEKVPKSPWRDLSDLTAGTQLGRSACGHFPLSCSLKEDPENGATERQKETEGTWQKGWGREGWGLVVMNGKGILPKTTFVWTFRALDRKACATWCSAKLEGGL